MTRHVRNFWLELTVDGRKSTIRTGPTKEQGGFAMDVYQRDEGKVFKAGYLCGHYVSGGELNLTWFSFTSGESTELCTTQRDAPGTRKGKRHDG